MPRLLPADALIKTGPVDHADWNYRPVVGAIQRLRFFLVGRMLPAGKVHRLLEIGYGSGVFMPELKLHCDELHGLDIHPCAEQVTQRLQERGVAAQLRQGTAELLPYQDCMFDCVVAVSSLEFVNDMTAAASELRRVLKPDGCLVMVTPGASYVVDLGLRLLTGESARRDYSDRRDRLMPALLSHFEVEKKCSMPPLIGPILRLYSAWRLIPIR